jgi:sortase (surface protein transpeptidase)
MRKMESRSACASVVDVQAEDQLLLLVTCLDGETERLVVAARRLRKNETENSLTLRQR